MSDNFDDWADRISLWQDEVRDIPALVRQDIIKSKLRPQEAEHGLRSLLHDPLSVQYAMGYKDRKYSLSYDVLKRIPHQLALVSGIIQTRQNQVAAFSVPYRSSKSVGFIIKHKDPTHLTTKSEMEFMQDLEAFISRCGSKKSNPHNLFKRDDFETFLKKLVRDSLTYDQACIEVVPDRRGLPYEFFAVDSATIRIAANSHLFGPGENFHAREPAYSHSMAQIMEASHGPFRTLKLYEKDPSKIPDFVQVVNGQIQNLYTREEMIFGVRNPRSDIYIQGYGYGELEQLVTIITAHLYAEEYNRRFFSNGSHPKGILNFKGDAMTPDQLEGFKRQWRATLEGTENAWRTPILQTEQGIDWIDLHPSNREMEYGQWMEYLIKITCSVFLIDPAELNFDLHGGVTQTPLFESSQEWKLKASRDRGLKPMLRFIARLINDNIVSKIDDRFVFDFVGLEELTEQEKHTLLTEQLSSYKTLNEVRRADDLPDLDYGDVPMNPTYLQAMQVKLQQEQQEQQANQLQQPVTQQGAPQGEEEPVEEEEPEDVPDYSDSVGKSLSISSGDTRVLEIDLSDLDSWRRGNYGAED